MADTEEKGKQLTPEESAFRNEAFRVIHALSQENKHMREMGILGRHPKTAGRRVASAPKIAGLEGLNLRMGQQFNDRE